jgi:predicted Zn-dependent peptidase
LRLTALSRAQALADDAAVYDDPNRINTELDSQLAITAADIERAAKARLLASDRAVVVTLPTSHRTGGREN